MSIKSPLQRTALVLAALVLWLSQALAGGVRIVDSSGKKNFPDIQSAIDAAVDGDVLLVGAGTYPGFTLEGKSLAIFAPSAGTQGVGTGDVTVQNLLDKKVVLCGLSAGRLTVSNCSGDLGFQGCSFAGPYAGNWPHRVADSSAVVFSGCTFAGGAAPACLGCSHGATGGAGLNLSHSVVATYGCTFQGGKGAYCCTDTGNGGDGMQVSSQSWCFASGCSFIGGDSGNGGGCGPTGTYCGFTGNGLVVDGGSEFHALSNGYTAGHEGANCCQWVVGMPFDCQFAAACDFLPGTSRSFRAAFVSADRTPWSLSAAGVPGDQVFLNRSLAPVFQYEPTLSGVCTSLVPPFAPVAPLGVVPASRSLAVTVPQRLLPDGVLARVDYLQGYVIATGGATVLGSPMYVLSLNWNAQPDCNGNGIQDYAEVIAGITPDLDNDLVPDGCP